MECECKNLNCKKKYDSQETSRIHGDTSWIYDYCSAQCFTQSIMKEMTTLNFALFEPIDGNVIAGPVKADNREDAMEKLIHSLGYEVIIVENDTTGDENEQG